MSFFSKIFGKKKTEPQAIVQDSPEVKSLFEFEQRMDTLLAQDRFHCEKRLCTNIPRLCTPPRHVLQVAIYKNVTTFLPDSSN